jgi:hypothetical protein
MAVKLHRKRLLSVEERRAQMRDYKRRERARHGWMSLQLNLDIDAAACLLYVKKVWGFQSRREAVQIALMHLARQTRLGLPKIQLGFDEEEN